MDAQGQRRTFGSAPMDVQRLSSPPGVFPFDETVLRDRRRLVLVQRMMSPRINEATDVSEAGVKRTMPPGVFLPRGVLVPPGSSVIPADPVLRGCSKTAIATWRSENVVASWMFRERRCLVPSTSWCSCTSWFFRNPRCICEDASGRTTRYQCGEVAQVAEPRRKWQNHQVYL